MNLLGKNGSWNIRFGTKILEKAMSGQKRAKLTEAKFAVGIDLGTTNCVLAAIDLSEGGRFPTLHTIDLDQRLDDESVGSSSRLPSFLFWPTEAQTEAFPPFSQDHGGWVLGEGAAELGRRMKGRLVTSAKSWLCHSRVDRTQPILPWGGEEGIPKISPLEATERLLRHLSMSWENHKFSMGTELKDQQLTITLPASFDQSARALTVDACKKAGLDNARLLEEPQAAFYNWVTLRQGRWDQALGQARKVLVCDIGGGTSDFSLIHCKEEDGSMSFEREAVGQHLLLGGDNMDLALAHLAESRLSGGKQKLNQSQWQLLSQLTRSAKESLLSGELEKVSIRLPGAGRKVIGGLRQAELTRDEVLSMVLDGFFPQIEDSYQPRENSGVMELGLPYEAEPAVTWHILNFLRRHGEDHYPEAVLFNGGALEPSDIRERIVDLLGKNSPSGKPIKVLESDSLASAVARGAAYYSYISLKGGLRIGGGSPMGFYLGLEGVDGKSHACVVPKGSEAHEKSELLLKGLEVHTNQPVSFELFQSDEYSEDESGELRQLSSSLEASGRLNTMVRFGKGGDQTIPVKIEGELTELDTLRLALVSLNTSHRWDLEFDLREPSSELESDENVEESDRGSGKEIPAIELEGDSLRAILEDSLGGSQPRSILKSIEKATEVPKGQWNLSFLRKVSDGLFECSKDRERSPDHEKIWLSTLSYCNRPGFGDPKDELRRQALWSLCRDEPISRRDLQCQREWAILWRRVSSGLETGKQADLFQRNKRKLLDKKGKVDLKGAGPELWRMLCSMEAMPQKDKARFGGALLEHLKAGGGQVETAMWCLGRLGARMPFTGQVENLLPREGVQVWIETLLEFPEWQGQGGTLALVECSRRCGDRVLDIEEGLRERVLSFLDSNGSGSSDSWEEPLLKAKQRELGEQGKLIGDGLPLGLTLKSS